ncbi:Na+/melibiose symporter-like transporter [Mumia flava]|uniref:Na+/melibiose symporter-like transporter n=1 Tax=Mumia flava TaxID=1348852 RepID=A0A0B2BLN6_9ACTN|nr:MFS transporter [Mumia flava]PJJ54250.1 Na+/melibiose symporter-like transporter [Mumia flava]
MTTTAATPRSQRSMERRITFLVALAVFAQESTWNFYDSQVPALLRDHLASAALIGLCMGMDNLLGIFIQPWMGNRSDRTRTSWGRRMPYLVVGMPIAALLFLLIPHAAGTLATLLVVMFAYALVANSFKPIGESLMPDFIAPERRSRANAAVKIASAITVIVAALISLLVVDDHPDLAFAIPSALMLISIAVLAATVRDSRSPAYQQALAEDADPDRKDAAHVRVRETLGEIVRDTDRSRLLIIFAIFLFGGAWAASRSLVTPYGMEVLDLTRGQAGGLTLPAGIAYIIAAYPMALIAERIGRLKVMIIGMAIFAGGMILATVVQTPAGTVTGLCIGAAGASGFMINAVVVLWNLAPSARVLGTYAGLHTVGWATGGFLGPAMIGAVVDVTSWSWMLLDIAVLTALAILVVVKVQSAQRQRADGRAL